MQVRAIERNIKPTKLNLKQGLEGILKNKCLKLQELVVRISCTAETEGLKEN